MFEFSNARIADVSLHFLDHESDNPKLHTTQFPLAISDDRITDTLVRHVIKPFKSFEDYHRFTYTDDNPALNPLKIIVSQAFKRIESFHDVSARVAAHLFQNSNHPGIKSGDLLVVKVEEIGYEDELIDAVVIVKTEQKSDFFKILYNEQAAKIIVDRGIQAGKLDKACMIFNTNAAEGYIVASIDKTSPALSAQYWTDDFLNITPLSGAYHQTKQYMNMAQTYVSHKMGEEIELPRGEQLTILHNAGEFFKSNESFSQNQFEEEVLGGSPEVIESFGRYKNQYARELNTDLPEDFALSNLAVKRSAKDFKSVLKLDKNFHVYIHGDRRMIEHGIDESGRKYYKLYYEKES